MVPLQAPEAVQAVALVLLQDRVLDSPSLIVEGLALKETVGGVLPVETFRALDWAETLPALS